MMNAIPAACSSGRRGATRQSFATTTVPGIRLQDAHVHMKRRRVVNEK
jgi:hypothetical protein